MLWQRLTFGILMIAALVGLILADGWLSARALASAAEAEGVEAAQARLFCGLPIMLLVVVLVILATYEMGQLLRAGGQEPLTHWAVFVGAMLAFMPWLEMQQRLSPGGPLSPPIDLGLPLPVFLLTGGLLGTCLGVMNRRRTAGAVAALGVTLLLMLYLGLLGSFVVRLRCLWPGPTGAAVVIFFVLTVKSGDIGAFFVGKLLGKNKLVPWLSPGKTVEGAVGALAMATAVAVGGMALWSRMEATLGPAPLGLTQALIFGAVMAIVGHLGDLTASLVKRDVGRKDSGRVVPAFGGLLDLVDSPIFAAPVAWWLLVVWQSRGNDILAIDRLK